MTIRTRLNSILKWVKSSLGVTEGLPSGVLALKKTYDLHRDMRIIKSTALFDAYYYLNNYSDVRLSACDPLRHYCELGWKENRNPSSIFNTRDYLENNPDIAAAGINPLAHYIKYGKSEGRYMLVTERGLVKPAIESKPHLGYFSRACAAFFTLPGTFFHYDGWQNWCKAIGSGDAFYEAVLERPDQCHERLAHMPKLLAGVVSTSLSIALRIQKNHGVLPSVRKLLLILLNQGPKSVLAQLKTRVSYNKIVAYEQPSQNRILVMDYRIPIAEASAGDRATMGILGDLCDIGYEAVFLPNDMASAPVYEQRLRQLGVTVITQSQAYESAIHYLSQQGHTFAAFYLIRLDVAEAAIGLIRQVAPQAKVIFHAPDLSFLREARETELKNKLSLHSNSWKGYWAMRFQRWVRFIRSAIPVSTEVDTRSRELAVISQVDRTVIVSPAELPVLRQFLPHAPISIFPVLYAPVVERPAPFTARKDIFFLGGFSHTPNIDATCWFAKEIWPLVHTRLPDAVFHVVGSEIPQAVLDLGALPGIVVDGFIEDLEPLLASMRLGVAPLRFGSGIKGKVAMTMGAGVPCVCTSIAAEGMGMIDGVHTRVADEPAAFAEAVAQLYTDAAQWEKLSGSGRQLVRDHFGSEPNKASLLSLLNEADMLPVELFTQYCQSTKQRRFPCPSESESVAVSIIIPVYNQWAYTQACLNSILVTCRANSIRYETILADDSSTDETQDMAKDYPGLRVVRTPKNLGFLRNCNNAAKHARGQYLIFLNNDTLVLPGWLPPLFQLIEEDGSAAIVGSKLLYPDRTIQEAGAVLWNDGTASNCGRNSSKNDPKYSYVREVDYVSGASFIVRKSFWDAVGGFDESYVNAYCEDSGLAMTARSKGMRVLYQPKSEVVHFEHKTYSDERTDYLLPLQRENIQRLYAKWQTEFKTAHLPPGTAEHIGIAQAQRSPSPSTLARRSQGRLNILYFTPFPSHPSSHGNQSTIQQFGRRFQAMGHKVHFALLGSRLFAENDLNDMRACWDTLDILPNSHPLGANGKEIPFDSWYEEGLGEHIRELCAQYDIDVVFCSYVFHSKLLEFVPAHMLKVIDTHDKMGNRYEMLRANSQPLEFFSCTPEEEGAYLRRADVVVARREEEARYFDSVTGLSTAIVIPHVEEPRFVEKTFTRLLNVGTVASANRINLAIVQECLAAIERRLHGNKCPFTVHVAGQVKDMVASLPPDEAAAFDKPWVRMHGFVPDIAKFYADIDAVISPVTMGTGINVKTVQAMAFGMPLLTTAWGAKGIETGDHMHTHADLDALTDSLFALQDRPDELQRLAAVSRSRYTLFYEESLASIRSLFAHKKLRGPIKH